MSAANALSSDQPSKPASDTRAIEPSMEDILASIRRIIADDQSRGLSSTTSAYRRTVVAPAALTLPVGPAAARLEEAVRAAEEEPAAASVPPVLPSARIAVLEPPLAAPDAAASPAWAAPAEEAPPVPSTTEDDLSVIAEIVNAGAAAILQPSEPAAPVPDPAAMPEAPEDTGVLSLKGFEASPEPREEPEPPAALAPPPPPARPAAEPIQAEPEVEPLLSAAVGASIGSSLQTLASTVFLQNTASVEAMTRDMLRPLLKTWLDDNLPTIVERLVRIEIERVARGVRS